jgi:hypothetical protein
MIHCKSYGRRVVNTAALVFVLITVSKVNALDLSGNYAFVFPDSIERSWESLLAKLPDRERGIASQIRLIFRVSDIIISPHAIFDNGDPAIVVPWEFAAMIMAVADSQAFYFMAMPLQIDRDAFSYAQKGYLNYVAERLKERKIGAQKASELIESSLQWIDADRHLLDQWNAAEQIYPKQQIFNAMVMFVLAHEAAHHLLGHTKALAQPYRQLDVIEIVPEDQETQKRIEKESPSADVTPKMKQGLEMIRKEMEADGWAADTLIRAGINPLYMAKIFQYYWALNCTSLKNMESSLYIADTLRLLHFINVALDNGFFWSGRTVRRTRQGAEFRELPSAQIKQLIELKNEITDYMPDFCI